MPLKAAGIVAEYNPLHNGHVYHMAKARSLTGCDVLVAAISGDFVQRGEPAIINKWKRAELALKGGADLVIEIPVLYCLGNAGQYAAGGVRLLESLGCTEHIVFGSECGDISLLEGLNGFLRAHAEEVDAKMHELTRSGYNYPVARARAYEAVRRKYSYSDDKAVDTEDIESLIDRELRILESSNDILGLEYINAMRSAVPVAVKREGAGYSDPLDIRFSYQSASAIRTQLLDGRDISRYVPEYTADMLDSEHLTGPDSDKWFDTLRYAVMSLPPEIIDDCPSGGEGLANLMRSSVNNAEKWTQFVRRVKSKRYTYTRISRLCMQTLLGIIRSVYAECYSDSPGYIRILGFNSRGRELLSQMKKTESALVPVITNINKEKAELTGQAQRSLELDVHAADIYNLMTGADLSSSSDHVMRPVTIL